MPDLLKRIVVNPKVMAGKPVIRGTRIPVYLILELLASGMTEDEVIREYPSLTRVDLKAALAYASKIVREEQVIPIQ
ncbi:MAG: DUF433 domain-containing protein [Nitrososphaerota archaeon]|nr:DUF433 domain-containing protein [Nitrososphaerota archaeon]